MKTHRPVVDSCDLESPKLSADIKSSENVEVNCTVPIATGSITRQRMREASQLLGSLLLGGVAILGSMLVFRKCLLPLIEVVFHPGPDTLSVVRRTGILLTAVGGYWAFVHYRQQRSSTELRIRPIQIMLAVLVSRDDCTADGLSIRCGCLRSGIFPRRLAGVTRRSSRYRHRGCFGRTNLSLPAVPAHGAGLGTKFALTIQAVVFALQHLENVAQGGTSDAVTMLVAVTLTGLLWARCSY